MKLFLASFLVMLLALSAPGQGTSVRANGGFGTNETWIGTSTFSGSLGSIVQINNGQIWGRALLGAPVFTGDGSGLTNLVSGLTNVPVTINVVFNGKVQFLTNIYVQQLNWSTNAMATITINANKAFEFLSTNNNISITGYSGLDGTNAQAFTRVFTNTAGPAAVKSITLPVGTLMLSSPWTNVVYNTNQGILSGVIYPGAGTNVSWTGN